MDGDSCNTEFTHDRQINDQAWKDFLCGMCLEITAGKRWVSDQK